MNKAFLMGNLGRDPEQRSLPSGKTVCSFSVATSEKRAEETYTEWHNVVVWGKQAEICASALKKGSRVFVDGQIRTRSYDDKNGVKKYTTEIVANFVTFLDKREVAAAEATEAPVGAESPF